MAVKVKVGILGMGIGMSHLANYRKVPNAEVIAICDKDEAWLKCVQREHGIAHGYTDAKKLLADKEVQAVSVCLPTALHAQWTIAALRAGKHVLCEKPMACNAREAAAMAAAAKSAKRVLAISQNRRFEPQSRYLRKLVDDGLLGDIYFARTGWRRPMGLFPVPNAVRATGTFSRNWFNRRDRGGGVLRDLGSHMLDLTMWLLNFPSVNRAISGCYCLFTPAIAAEHGEKADAEDFGSGMVLFNNGVSLQCEMSFGSFIEKETVYLDLYGTKGGASLRDGVVKLFAERHGASTMTTIRSFPDDGASTQSDFIRAIQTRSKPLAAPEQGVGVIKVLDALYAGGIRYSREITAM
jgi:predicted dehydrogenase